LFEPKALHERPHLLLHGDHQQHTLHCRGRSKRGHHCHADRGDEAAKAVEPTLSLTHSPARARSFVGRDLTRGRSLRVNIPSIFGKNRELGALKTCHEVGVHRTALTPPPLAQGAVRLQPTFEPPTPHKQVNNGQYRIHTRRTVHQQSKIYPGMTPRPVTRLSWRRSDPRHSITPPPPPDENTLASIAITIRIIDDRVVRTPFSVREVGRYKQNHRISLSRGARI